VTEIVAQQNSKVMKCHREMEIECSFDVTHQT